jgi:hypothetical protein
MVLGGADALPEHPHPVLLLNANNLRFRAVVKTATGRALNLPRSVLRRNTGKNGFRLRRPINRNEIGPTYNGSILSIRDD